MLVKPTLLLNNSLIVWTASALAIGAFALAACSGPGSGDASGAVPPASKTNAPLVRSSASPTPIPFNFKTVDDPNSETNAVMGINQLSKIVGMFGGGSGSNIDESYTSRSPWVKFRPYNYSGAQGTVATSVSSNEIIAGYVIDPTGIGGTQGFAVLSGLWTILADPNEGSGNNDVTEIFGVNDSEYAVGYYLNEYGMNVPFVLDIPTQSYTNLNPPGAINAEATGINGKGSVSGWVQTSDTVKAFFLRAGSYYEDAYPGAQATYALSLNWQDQLVGDYVDSSGLTHGFVLTYPTNGGAKQIWQSVDDPNAAYGTWITGINNHDAICGYYKDASGIQHGFVATP
jgi:hypothetical protein